MVPQVVALEAPAQGQTLEGSMVEEAAVQEILGKGPQQVAEGAQRKGRPQPATAAPQRRPGKTGEGEGPEQDGR